MTQRLSPLSQPEILEDDRCLLYREPCQLVCAPDLPHAFSFLLQDHTEVLVCEDADAAGAYRKLFLEILGTLKEKLEVAKSILADEQERMVMVQEEEQNFREMIESERRIFQLIIKISEEKLKNHPGSLNWRDVGLIQLREPAKELEKSQETIRRLNNLSRENMMKLQKSEATLVEQICSLQNITAGLELMCGQSDSVLLQNAEYYLERGESLLHQCLEMACITEPSLCHASGMSRILKSFQTPVTLDPDTAHPCLVLSEDLRSVSLRAAWQAARSNPREFDFSATVLGAEGFTSGWHYWEVEVGKATGWQLGICGNADGGDDGPKERKILLTRSVMGNQSTFWVYPPLKMIFLQEHMSRIGVFLYYEYGQLSFHDVTEGHLIYNFSNLAFQGVVRPLFSLCVPNGGPTSDTLSLCPVPVSPGTGW